MADKNNYSFSDMLFSSAFIHNPVLIQAAGLCAVAAVATTLKTSVLLAAVFFPVMLVTQMIACLLLKKVPRFVRVTLYMLIGTAITAPIIYLIDRIDPSMRLGAGIYLALTAVNSITALHCEKFAVKTKPLQAFYDAVAASIGYAAVIILVGFVRELIGSATVWGKAVKLPFTVPALLMPFGGFVVIAFCAAGLKALINRRFPEYSGETDIVIKKDSVIVSKKNLPENLVQEKPEAAPEQPETAESEPDREQLQEHAEKTDEVKPDEEAYEADKPVEYDIDIMPLEPIEGEESLTDVDISHEEIFETFKRDGEDSEGDDEFGSTLSLLFEAAESFSDSDSKPDGEEDK